VEINQSFGTIIGEFKRDCITQAITGHCQKVMFNILRITLCVTK